MDTPQVILVDDKDRVTGFIEKIEAHQKGLLHRAFSVFIFNAAGEMLLQQRALNKYHSPGLWSNACCSHPSPGEETEFAAQRRLFEELGFSTSLKKVFDFIYHASFENGLTENEFDHVFVGYYDGKIKANLDEVSDYSFKTRDEISHELTTKPGTYTVWFQIIFSRIEEWWAKKAIR
jgi:isopentenyl-diphosphate delta-isomerase